ncbi:MAG TPA: mechanosensitive ion channel family protein [Thermoanaerobaculia bacterium]|nr:mechanosensitive ion channel family protein [Thermoanaerobaculia bacterium]
MLISRQPGLARQLEPFFGSGDAGLKFLAWVPLIFALVRGFDLVIFDVMMSRQRNVVAPQLLRDIMSIGLYLVLFIWVSGFVFNYPIRTWLATGGVLAVVLGLALQETLGNLFAGIALHLEDSFETGDVIRSGDYIGVVERTRWRGTRIRTFNNNVVIIPNSQLARERLEVFPRSNLNARIVTVGVDYHVAPATVIQVLMQAAAHVEGVAREMPCVARVGGFGDSAVNYEVKYYTRDYSARDRIDADIRKAIWYAMRRNNIGMAFPIRAYQPYTPPAMQHDKVPHDEVLARLQDVDILQPLSADARETLAAAARVHLYSKGETIIRRQTAGDSMFVVHDGTVSVRITDDDDGSQREVTQLMEGSVFGEMALLTGEPRTADVVATTDVIAIEIAKEALQPILHSHPELAGAISKKVTERRDRLESVRAYSPEDEQMTVLSRIRAYFGL